MPTSVTNQDSSQDVQSAILTVAAQNLYGVPFAKNMPSRTAAFVADIDDDRYFPDFVSVEEAFLPRMRKGLKTSVGHPYFARSSEVGCHFLNGGLAALSAYPIVLRKFVPFKRAHGSDALANKGVLLTRVKHPVFGEIDFYTTHMQAAYKSPDQYDETRLSQVLQIGRLIAEESGDRTVVLMGDINTLEGQRPYEYLTEDEDGPRLIDVMREMDPDADLDTWRPDNPYIADTETYQRLDYILIRPGAGWEWDREASRGHVTRPCDEADLADDVCLDSPVVSDHAGVLARLEFRRTG